MLRLAIVLENVIPRVLGWVPISWRRTIIERPDKPSRVTTLAHNLLNRMPPGESQVYECQGPLGILFRMPSLALSVQYAVVNPAPNNRRMWMR